MEFKLQELNKSLSVSKIANVHFFEFEKNYSTKNDCHPFCELLFSYSGNVNVVSENFDGALKKGEMIIHQHNEQHSLFTQKNKNTTVIIIGFQCTAPQLQYFSKHKILLNEIEIKQLARIVKEGRNVFAPPYDKPLYHMKKKNTQIFASEQILQSLLEIFLIELIRKYNYHNHKEQDVQEKNFPLKAVLEYIDNHFTDKITLDEIAFLFNTNRSLFCREFKVATGTTFINYINEKKIQAIKQALAEGVYSISEIAALLHFESTAYLCRFFKKHTGLTPNEYRHQNVQ